MPVDRNDTVCAMSQVCQVAVGEVLTAPAPWPGLDPIAERFTTLPSPLSPLEAMAALGVAVAFAVRLGEEMHWRAHGRGHARRCAYRLSLFDVAQSDTVTGSRWTLGTRVARWLRDSRTSVLRWHGDDLVSRAQKRLSQTDQPVSIVALSRELACSTAVLERSFVRQVGMTPAGYRRRVRAAEAIKRLAESQDKVETIARELAWNSKKDLYAALKALANVTPGDIRKMGVDAARLLALGLLRQ
jgi:AraC-like DNA-binding protein